MAEYITFQPRDFYNTKLYTGTGAELAITGVGFQPDITWIKNREQTDFQVFTNAVSGAGKYMETNDALNESTNAECVKSYDADGFTLGTMIQNNTSAEDYASWNWKAGTTTGLSGGTITPTSYSINTTSGFGIYAYTGTATNATIAHGLGVAPKMVIVKRITTGSGWIVQQTGLATANHVIKLNDSAAQSSDSANFNGTYPDATVFNLGTSNNTNKSGDGHLAYVFAEKKGYSKIGNYVGNGNADGTFVYTGFRPAFVLLKTCNRAGTDDWCLFDNKREGYNVDNDALLANTTAIERTQDDVDLLSNGFKLRYTATDTNPVGNTVIYIAFAEFPIVSSNDIPGVAR